MDSVSPDATRTAGQPILSSGINTFAFGNGKTEFARAFAFDWLGVRFDSDGGHRARHRDPHRPRATGYGHAA